ncbi:MAG TPA: hypothetical protein PLE10_07465 [Brevefilum sp.]|nr:hypothetical protein [Brevefilum sp.]HPL70056.1 hypothetical protein [Brevefilum sp.]
MAELLNQKIANLSLVIALDNSSAKICHQVSAILTNQGKIVPFYKFLVENENIQLVPIDDRLVNSQEVQTKPESKTLLKASIIKKSLNDLTAQIEQRINELYSHIELISQGAILTSPIPLDIILVGDLKEDQCSQIILPMILVLHNVSTRHFDGCLHLLLNMAVFKEDKEKDLDLRVYKNLLELNELQLSVSSKRTEINKLLNFQDTPLDRLFTYLFHTKKQDGVQITNAQEMALMVGNNLYTLLISDMVRKVATEADSCRSTPSQSDFCSMGSVMLSYDPASLTNYCRNKSIKHTLENIILTEGSEAVAKSIVIQADKLITDSSAWISEMFQMFPVEVSSVTKDGSDHTYTVRLKHIDLGKVDFANFHGSDNLEIVDRVRSQLENELIPKWNQKINSAASELVQKIKTKISEYCTFILQDIKCYPGGIENVKQALNFLEEDLKKEEKTLLDRIKYFEKEKGEIIKRIEKGNTQKKQIIKVGPDQPKTFSFVPQKINTLYLIFYYHLFYFFPLMKFRRISKVLPDALEKFIGYQIQFDAACAAINIIQELTQYVDTRVKKLEELINLLNTIKTEHIASDPVGEAINGWNKFFRISAIDSDMAEIFYNNYKQADEVITRNLIHKEQLFSDWENNPENCGKTLIEFHEKMFSLLAEKSLYDIHAEYTLNPELTNPLSKPRIIKYLDASLPLLNPNSDTGAMKSARKMGYYLIGFSDWSEINIADEINKVLSGWEVKTTDNPFAIVATQVWHSVPLKGFVRVFNDEKEKLERKLREEKGKTTEIVREDYAKIIYESEQIIKKEFQWGFNPKGSKKAYNFIIELSIDKTRYKKYCKKPRNIPISQYNLYAQEDMPEINDLVLEFQKIFSEHKNWSTFTKAQCVLRFVQTVVTYRYDIDTKGHREWPRYPIETLLEGVGDCEDVAILCAAILVRLGLDVVLFYIIFDDKRAHMAFGVAGSPKLKGNYIQDPATGKNYYFGEATSKGWSLGQIPADCKNPPEAIIYVQLLVDDEGPE